MTYDRHEFRYLDLLISIFIVVLLISNLVAQKICAFGPLRVSGALLLFPITYIFGDIFTEVYGYGASRKATWIGFLASGLMALLGTIIVALPPAPDWPNQAAFATVFSFIPRLVAASLLAFWCGEFANSYTLAKLKLVTQGKYLWTRTVGSTVVGQAVDTTLVVVFAFGGSLPLKTMVSLILTGYVFKVVYEVAMTPVTYAVVNFLKRKENLDTFDYGINFSPFVAGFVSEVAQPTAVEPSSTRR